MQRKSESQEKKAGGKRTFSEVLRIYAKRFLLNLIEFAFDVIFMKLFPQCLIQLLRSVC